MLAATRVLTRHEPQPSRQMSAVFKGTRVPDNRHHRGGDQGSHALDRSKPATDFRSGKDALDPSLDLMELSVQCDQLSIEVLQELATQAAQLLGGILQEAWQPSPHLGDLTRECYAVFH